MAVIVVKNYNLKNQTNIILMTTFGAEFMLRPANFVRNGKKIV